MPTFVTGYQTEDGIFFEHQEDAVRHEDELRFIELYTSHEIYNSKTDSQVSIHDLLIWIKSMPEQQLKALSSLVDSL